MLFLTAELAARRRQVELEQATRQSQPLSRGEPVYDEVASTSKMFAVQQCPAYAPLPPPRL